MSLTVNKKLGKLTLLEQVRETVGTRTRFHWLCRCDCGKTKKIRQDNITMGLSRSCGCEHKVRKSREIGDALAAPWGAY